MGKYFAATRRFPNYERVIALASAHFYVTPEAIVGPARHHEVAHARHIAMYVCYHFTKRASYPTIAHTFGNRDHTTVMTAVEKIRRRMPDDLGLRADVEALRGLVLTEPFYALDDYAPSGAPRIR